MGASRGIKRFQRIRADGFLLPDEPRREHDLVASRWCSGALPLSSCAPMRPALLCASLLAALSFTEALSIGAAREPQATADFEVADAEEDADVVSIESETGPLPSSMPGGKPTKDEKGSSGGAAVPSHDAPDAAASAQQPAEASAAGATPAAAKAPTAEKPFNLEVELSLAKTMSNFGLIGNMMDTLYNITFKVSTNRMRNLACCVFAPPHGPHPAACRQSPSEVSRRRAAIVAAWRHERRRQAVCGRGCGVHRGARAGGSRVVVDSPLPPHGHVRCDVTRP